MERSAEGDATCGHPNHGAPDHDCAPFKAEKDQIVMHARGDLRSTAPGAQSLCNQYGTEHYLTAASDNRIGVNCRACLAVLDALEGTAMSQRARHQPTPDPDLDRGLYGKFRVERLASSGRGIDHSDCRYFALDPQHDLAALAALARYAQVVRSEGFGPLADDLDAWVADVSSRPGQDPS